MLLHIPIAMNISAIKVVKQMFMVVFLQNICYTPTILNFVLSGYNPPCILKALSSTWHPE
jgi:hypothetical protein